MWPHSRELRQVLVETVAKRLEFDGRHTSHRIIRVVRCRKKEQSMSSVMQLLADQLGGESLKQLSQYLGADQATTQNAIGAALPLLIGAAARNSETTAGASALHGALSRDHDGGILNDLGSILGGGSPAQQTQSVGAAILKHLLGGGQQRVQQSVSQSSGLNVGATAKLLAMLAPILMGLLGKKQRGGSMSSGALKDFLGRERQTMEQQTPQMGLLGKLMDADGDGDVDLTDIMRHGATFFRR